MRKKTIIGIIRWALFISLLIFSILQLYLAAFSSWASWGPPTEFPRAWAHEALLHFGYSISLLATSVMILIGLRTGYSWRASRMKYLWALVILIGIGYPIIKEWVLIDKCLDSGGTWNEKYFECRK